MIKFKNYKKGVYCFSGKKRDYAYDELKEYFYIDGSEVIYCKKDFGQCEAKKYYLIANGTWYGCGFVVQDWNGFSFWVDKEYMANKN